MSPIVEQLNFLLALGALALQIAAIVLFVLLLLKKDFLVMRILGRYGIHIVFLLSLSGAAMTLVYSEVFGFLPCGLCWLQRVFLYPQVILSGMALLKKDRHIVDYLIGLSVFGAVFSLYQHYLQMGGTELVGCPVVSTGADCARRILFEFGYITFPFLAFSMFGFVIALMFVVRKYSRD